MSMPSNDHLSDEQFTECAMYAPSAAAEAHLTHCDRCQKELKTFDQSMHDFGRATAAWSEAVPKRSLRPLLQQTQRRTLVVRSAWAFAAVLLFAVSLPIVDDHREAERQRGIVAARDVNDSQAQIAADNQLMQSVYLALTPSDASPLQEYGMQVGPDASGQARGKVRLP